MSAKIQWDKAAWDALVQQVIAAEGVKRMQRVAAAANDADGLTDGYRVSVEGAKPLQKHDYRATVITATGAAIRANAQNNTLVNEFYRAGD